MSSSFRRDGRRPDRGRERRRSIGALLLVLLLLPSACGEEGPPPGGARADTADLVVSRARVVDVVEGRVLDERSVVVRNGRISAVVDPDAAPPARRTLDGGGRYLIPGLWDGHVHFRGGAELARQNRALLDLFVPNGVTTVRDAGGDITTSVLEWRRDIRAGRAVGPRIFTSGPKLDGPTGGWPGSIRLASPGEAPAALDSLQALGADYVKIYDGSIEPEIYLAIVREAERREMPVTGHMPFTVLFRDAVEAGLDATEHLYYAFKGTATNEEAITEAVRAGELGFWDALARLREGRDTARARRLYRLMAREGTAVVPTLHIDDVLSRVASVDHADDPELRYVPPAIRETYRGRVESAEQAPAETRRERRERHEVFRAMVPAMHAEGVSVIAGSDAGPFNSYVYPGFSLHAELEALVEAGLTPVRALRSATLRPAQLLAVDDELGRIAEGYRADLVLLKENPLEDIAHTRSVAAVVLRGRDVLEADELEAMLEEVANREW